MEIENIRQYFDKKEIDTVAFDVDNTLMATAEYYRKHITQATILLAEKIDKNKDPIEISEELATVLFEEFRRNGRKPMLISDEFINALEIYLGKRETSFENIIINYFKDFYTTVPEIYPSIKDLLQSILKTNRQIVLHSHAGEEWTTIKAKKLSELIGYDIPYLATPIDQKKDMKNWLKALNLVNADPINTLVVGDNLEADILPMLEAGSRNATLINRHDEQIPEEYINNEDINISVISDISELFDTFK